MTVADLPCAFLRALRLRAQRLYPAAAVPDVASLAAHLCGIQAQDPAAAALAIRARTTGLTAADVDRARVETRAVVRTWAMRYTLHLLDARDVRGFTALLGPTLIRRQRARHAQLGLNDVTAARALAAIRTILGDAGPLTRAELMERLRPHDVPTAGQAAAHLVSRAAMEGLICLGPDRGPEPTYVLLDDWLPSPGGETSVAGATVGDLVLRYLTAFGPAQPEDFVSWSGLGLRDTRAAFAALGPSLVELTCGGVTYWLPASRAPWLDAPEPEGALVRLLPAFDLTMLGYASRAWIVPEAFDREVNRGGGMVRPVLLIDGVAAGTWRLRRAARSAVAEVTPFAPLAPEVLAALEAEARDVGRFVGLETRLDLF